MSASIRDEDSGRVVVAEVFGLERAIVLARASGPGVGRGGHFPPAVLVIPRGGGLRDPYLVVLDRRGDAGRNPAADLDFVDYHVVTGAGAPSDRGWNDVADVLFRTGERSWSEATNLIAALLDRHPGAAIAVCGGAFGHVAGVRDGGLIRVISTAAGSVADPVAPLGGYGSFLHAWLAAGLPVGCLEQAVVIAGNYVASRGGYQGRLLVAVRAHIHCVPPPHGRTRSAA